MTAIDVPAVRREPFFHEIGTRRLFAIRFVCDGLAPRGAVVFLAPFGEEMNRARRMMTLQAEALARRGYPTWVFDYSGTGDSDGEFSDSTFALWLADSRAVLTHAAATGPGPLILIAIRLAAPLACELLRSDGTGVSRLVLWQPVVAGSTWLTQFLRIRLAADLEAGAGRETTKDLRARIAAGETLEIAGYALGAGLAQTIDGLKLAELTPSSVAVDWFELVAEASADPNDIANLLPMSRPVVAAWQAAGLEVTTENVVGDPFWAIQEITTVPALLDATCRAITGEGM